MNRSSSQTVLSSRHVIAALAAPSSTIAVRRTEKFFTVTSGQRFLCLSCIVLLCSMLLALSSVTAGIVMHFQRTRKQVADLCAVRGREDKLERSHTDLNTSMQVLLVVGPLVLSSQSLFLVIRLGCSISKCCLRAAYFSYSMHRGLRSRIQELRLSK